MSTFEHYILSESAKGELMMRNFCQKPDHDIPGIVCGHPLPCPYHTVTIELNAKPVPTITYPVTLVPHITPKAHERLKRVAKALRDPIYSKVETSK